MFSRRPAWLSRAAEEGLTPPAALTLLKLRDDAPPPLNALAGALHCDASYMTAIADRLEERGLARRRVAPHDRRVKELVLTQRGIEARDRIRASFLVAPPGFDALSDEDLEALRRIAGRLVEEGGASTREALGLFGLAAPDEVAGEAPRAESPPPDVA